MRQAGWHSVKVLSQQADGLILLILPTVYLVKKYNWQLLVLAAALTPAPPVVHHQTSTILTSAGEISCQAFILLRDQDPSCSCLNITLLHSGVEIAGEGGISRMGNAGDPECHGLTSGLWVGIM